MTPHLVAETHQGRPRRARRRAAARCSARIALQYNPDTLTRSYQVQGVGGEGGGERAQPFRLKGPADRVDQARRRDRRHRPARVSRPERQRRGSSASRRSSPRSRRWSIRASTSCWRSTALSAQRARSRSCRRKRRWCCSSGARAASCRCASPSSRSPRRPSIRALNPIRAKVSLGLRVLTHRRPRLRAPRRHHLHQLPAHARGAGGARPARDAWRRSASPTCRDGAQR